jgi:lipopolysaccharide/colanic/teichoic acid biosynthesis glycosyltransferase
VSFYRRHGKRLLDVALATPALALAAPLMVGTAALVAARLGRPVLFKQERAGLGGAPFTVLKFRTMSDARGADGRLLSDGARLTPLGRTLRAMSLDELPQLWNVLRGEMSIVGPRPLYVRYVPRYDEVQARRLEVRPGITGWSQVNGRNATSWEDKLALDAWYARHLSLKLDVEILARTVGQVLRRSDIVQPGEVTTAEFMGSPGGVTQ